ncbi:para-nitrobenzyl esterase [Sphingomonas guangdongensis]|uniref:Carboxylic ester hydrolase n=1 Tax=Sphingomonas guangdongensis TaxID=1141890 RepID=A0A285R1Y9_9SPHN|nr:carboxylesterase family protein [Sphingomonas guangdongensis]SOB86387.1 para-nitrobenzyl esterase [Sphingomonas guangdongensis]
MKTHLIGLLLASAAVATTPAQAQSTEVTLDSGRIRGTSEDGVLSWKGVPFAKPPLGALRWRAPQRPEPWSGVRAATAYSSDCMQVPFPSDAAPLGTTPAENCLYANVWRPATAGKNLPVMVWIYGGGFVNGGASPPTYAGANLAREGIVFVSFNYRVGRFGTFALPQLTAENKDGGRLGNYGAMDQIAALEWVKRNVAAFGGDPANVTIIGESAGGMSVHNLVTSPLSQGLFQRAVVMSGGDGTTAPRSLAEVEKVGQNFARRWNIDPASPDALTRLRALSQEQVTDGLNMMRRGSGPETVTGPFPDGKVLVDLDEAYAADRFAKVPMLIGATSADIGGKSGFMIAGARDASAVIADKGVPVWEYRFSYVAESIPQPGAQHAAEIPYFFDNTRIKYGTATTPRDEQVGNTVSRYLLNFVKTGDPNGPGLAFWPKYSRSGDEILDFTPAGRVVASRDSWGPEIEGERKRIAEARASGRYNTLTTNIGTLLDDPAAKAIVTRYFPDFVTSPQIGMARGSTFNAIKGYLPQVMTDEKLAALDKELAAVPVRQPTP